MAWNSFSRDRLPRKYSEQKWKSPAQRADGEGDAQVHLAMPCGAESHRKAVRVAGLPRRCFPSGPATQRLKAPSLGRQ